MNKLAVFDNTNLEYGDMDIEQLFRCWYEELELCKDSFSEDRLQWFKSINSANYYMVKIATMNGYLMATRDNGKNVGDLVRITLELLRRLRRE